MEKKNYFYGQNLYLTILFFCLLNSYTANLSAQEACPEAKIHFDRSIQLIENEDYVPALTAAQKAVNASENCTPKERARYYVLRARVYEQLQVPQNAAKDFQKAQKLLTQIVAENPTPTTSISKSSTPNTPSQPVIPTIMAAQKQKKASSKKTGKKPLTIDFEWLSHRAGKRVVPTQLPEQLIQLKVVSNQALKSDNFEVLINNHDVKGARFGYQHSELELLSDNEMSSQKAYTYRYSYYPLLKEGKNKVAIKVNKNGLNSQSPSVQLNFTPVNNTLKVIGIATDNTAKFAINNAKDFVKSFEDKTEKITDQLFNQLQTETLTGETASAQEITELLKNQELTPNDFLIIHFSAQAFTPSEAHQLYLQGSDYDPDTFLGQNTLTYTRLQTLLDSIRCQKLLILDICHPTTVSLPPNLTAITEQSEGQERLSVLLANGAAEFSHEDEEWQNSALTEALLIGLQKGYADGYNPMSLKDGIISINELFRYVADKVPQLVSETDKSTTQTPQLYGNALDELGIFVTGK